MSRRPNPEKFSDDQNAKVERETDYEAVKEISSMIIIPRDPEMLRTSAEYAMKNMANNKQFKVVNHSFIKGRGLLITLEIDGVQEHALIAKTDVQITENIRIAQFFTKEEKQQIGTAQFGMRVSMLYLKDPVKTFYYQLRILDGIIPDGLAVLDCSANQLLSGRWAKMAANALSMPAPKHLFSVKAVSRSADEVWLFTSGLKRCGLYELEVFCSDKDNYLNHWDLIEQFGIRMLDAEETIQEKQGVLLAELMDQGPLVATAVDWKEALKYYPNATIGTAENRAMGLEEKDSCAIMLYKSSADEKAGRLSIVQEYNKALANNPMYYVSTPETNRMRRLAQERIEYLRRGLNIPESKVVAKIALTKDKVFWEGNDPEVEKEHIWFDVTNMGRDTITGVLTQEPYWVAAMKPGDIGTYPFSDVTDWMILAGGQRITPDEAYILEDF